MILLHKVNLVGVLSVDVLHWLAEVVLLGIKVRGLGEGRTRDCRFAMAICWENLREGVSHSHLAIECFAEEGLSRVQTSVSHSMLGGWRERVVQVFIWQLGLKVDIAGRKQPHPLRRLSSTCMGWAGTLSMRTDMAWLLRRLRVFRA